MRRTAVAPALLAALISTGVPARQAAACDWHCSRAFPPREYWQWGWHQPSTWDPRWDSPIGHFWGTPEPPLVPADVWARKWHPPWLHRWRGHRHP